jgi:acetylornithine deacetylase/succinyl-diaminopimelate desuccinylase-like protein
MERVGPSVSDEIRPRLKMSITPTIIHGGYKENVIPSECEAVFDCRVLPGQTTSEAMAKVKELLRDIGLDKLSFENIQAQEPTESPTQTPLFHVISEALSEADPGWAVVPFLMAGGTDSRFFRRMGSVCYGFQPLRRENSPDQKPTRLEHGVDERISVENLVFGVSVLYETVKRFMT